MAALKVWTIFILGSMAFSVLLTVLNMHALDNALSPLAMGLAGMVFGVVFMGLILTRYR